MTDITQDAELGADPGAHTALDPVTPDEKTWGWFAIFNIWANDVQSLFGYSLVASLFISYGVSGCTAFAGLIAAGLFTMWMVNLSGAPGEKYGIPYPVLARASLGTQGAKLPAIPRAFRSRYHASENPTELLSGTLRVPNWRE